MPPSTAMNHQEPCFALLDDCRASESDPRSRLYTGFDRVLTAGPSGGFPGLLAELEEASRQGLHAVGLFSYEDGAELQGIAPWTAPAHMPSQVLLFNRVQPMSSAQVDRWLQEQAADGPNGDSLPAIRPELGGIAGVAGVQADIDDSAFTASVERIRQLIEAGDTYQVNFTYRLRFSAYGSPAALYRRLRVRQPVPYGALIALPSGQAVLSLSPELFVRHHQGELTAQPMKGTAPAGDTAADDSIRAEALARDGKNRAENLMIVDLLRNDLGRVAVNGSVRVPALFDIARYHTLLQMTSTVQATLREEVTLPELITALFPCGSITGAPKRRTMEIVRALETSPRGWYTGAIGWFDPPVASRPVGDFCMSVPIRTLVLNAPDAAGRRVGGMGVGAGIVHDSVAADEHAECRLKTRFLTGLRPQFDLFETIRVARGEGCSLLLQHLRRLRASADVLGFPWDEEALHHAVQQAVDALPPSADGLWRMRLALSANGEISMQAASCPALETPVTLLIAPRTTTSADLFLQHKTTLRAVYDAAWREAERQGAFDMLFRNQDGAITEGGRCNVFIRRHGRWMTPPLSAGVLPGVMRASVLADPAWNAIEANFTIEDLLAAEEVMVCNALRGVLPAMVRQPDASAG